ncbi:BLUF domain-containing protein [uncultured Mucilaginibacter sp.]|uniref:BLUF domain-containing protein n=1 Tax=uncultured Mucilaginibacter sp. TaxID=797541 RepID=UPI0025CF9190|nr:BLUF domain-containing protein [uncultured Mucilaginibacter sp.]
MKYLVYISTADHLMNQDELLDILEASRKNNKKNNLTGMLLYGEGVFIQMLEGEPSQLAETYKAIEHDFRHKNIIKMTEGEMEQRHFPEWRMGFKAANADELAQFDAYIDPRQPGFLSSEKSNAIINMMKTFADTNRMSDNY